MNKKIVTTIIVLAIAGAGYLAYIKLYGGGGNKKARESDVDYLKSNGFTTGDISNLERGFVSAWAKGAKSGDEFFGYNGKSFNVKGGRAVN